jgi:enoyl-[acyl-carrier protein] reductase I
VKPEDVKELLVGNILSDNMNKGFDYAAAFQKLWTNTLRDNARRVAQDAENFIKTMATYPRASISNLLKGKKGLVTGVANGNSIAYGAARAFHEAGAEIMLTCRRPKTEQYVRPLLRELGNPALLLCDVSDEEQLQAVFEHIGREWGKLDFLLHSITYASKEDLHGRVVDCSREGFKTAMEISCYSFIRMAKLAEPLMKDGGCLLTMTYYGAEKVIEHYNIIGPVKAALECAVRYMASELGPNGIRVHAISPGPIKTRAASGIDGFEELEDQAARRAPIPHRITIDDVGAVAVYLVSDAAAALTGHTVYADAGYHILG